MMMKRSKQNNFLYGQLLTTMAEFKHPLKHKKLLPYVLCVEGNIGSGKSTLLHNLKKRGFTVIEEPVKDIWGQYLPRLYEDAKRWGFAFQMEAMDWFRQLQSNKFKQLLLKMQHSENEMIDDCEEKKDQSEDASEYETDTDSDQENKGDAKNSQKVTRLSPKKQLLSNISPESNKVIIVERSALSAIGIFAKNLLETELMTEWEYSLLERFYSMIAWEAMHILYLQTDPQICCKRIKKRNRDGEGNMDPVLMERLHKKHECLFNAKGSTESQNIVIVDGSKSSEKVLREALQKISTLEIPSKKICGTIDCCV